MKDLTETGVSSTGSLTYVYLVSIVAAVSGLLFGFDIAVINGAIIFLRDQFGLSEFQTEVAELQGRLDSLKAVLPDEKDYADLLRRIQTLATQSNLTVQTFTPQAPVTKQIHAEWPITLELEGSYHNLATFFDRVGKFTRIVNITGSSEPRGINAANSAKAAVHAWAKGLSREMAKHGITINSI